MDANIRTLSPLEAKVILSLVERGQEKVTLQDIYELLGPRTSARKVVHNLVRKGWLARLVPGRYLLLPPEHGAENLGENNALALASAAAPDAYVAWWSAASFHGFTPQAPMTVYLAARKARSAVVVEGTMVQFFQLPEHKFFGFEQYDVYGRSACVSSPAKTLVDCVDRPPLCGGNVELTRITYAALAELDHQEVLGHALRMRSKSLLQRLGFLADLVGHPFPEHLRRQMQVGIGRNLRSVFGRRSRRDGDIGFVSGWGLVVHMSEQELLSDLPLRRESRA